MLSIRHQLAVYSPVTLGHVVRGLLQARRGDQLQQRLQGEIASEYGAARVELFQSGTAALQIAIRRALQQTATNSIALPAFCCYDVASAAVGAECRISLYDIVPETLSPNLESLERLLGSGVRAIVVASMYGIPVEWEHLQRLAGAYDALLIEDAAQGHGASYRGRPLGSLGELSVLSFGRGKGWTGGRGGALLHRSGAEIAAPAGQLSSSGRMEITTVVSTLAQWALGRPSLYGIPMSISALGLGETHYHDPSPPAAMPYAALGILASSRSLAAEEARTRRRNAAALAREVEAKTGAKVVMGAAAGQPGHLRLPVLLPSGGASLVDAPELRRLGVARSYPTTLAALPVVQDRHDGPDRVWPGAERLVDSLITLPTHSRQRTAEREALVNALRSAIWNTRPQSE